MLIKTPLLPQSSGPPVLLSLPLPLSLLQADPLERRGSLSSLSCPGFEDPLPKALCTFTPSRGLLRPCDRASPVPGALLAFCVNQGISASSSPLLSYRRLWTTRFWSIKGPQQKALNSLSVIQETALEKHLL